VGAFDVDVALIALRHHFATSVLSTHMLRRRGVKDIIAHVESEREGVAIRAVGATAAIFPERDMAERVAQHILVPDLADQIPLGGDAAIIEVVCPKNFVGKSLKDLDVRRNYDVSIIAVKTRSRTGGERVAVVPSPDKLLRESDVLFALGRIEALERFVRTIGATSTALDLGALEIGDTDE
jgi:trk system potassium uptake protein TrkA